MLAHDRICRVVSPIADLIEVQEWMGEYWLPSGLTLSVVRASPPATRAMLEARGVPREDWGPSEGAPMLSAAEILLFAMIAGAVGPNAPATIPRLPTVG